MIKRISFGDWQYKIYMVIDLNDTKTLHYLRAIIEGYKTDNHHET